MEHCVQFYAPYYTKDMDVLEKVQCRASNVITGLRELFCLEKVQGDLINVYNYLMGRSTGGGRLLSSAH